MIDFYQDIKLFLFENGIEWTESINEYDLVHPYLDLVGTDYRIVYCESVKIRIAYPKFGISGVKESFAYEWQKDQKDRYGKDLFFIRDFEWDTKFGDRKHNVLKSYILAMAGKVKRKIYGRDTYIKIISNKEARPLLDSSSFYGYRSASVTFGLFTKKDLQFGEEKLDKDSLVMLHSVGIPFLGRENNYDLECIRSSTLLNTQVLGGASKLFKAVCEYDFKPLMQQRGKIDWSVYVYYVDSCHNFGKSMAHMGFEFLRDSGAAFLNVATKDFTISGMSPVRAGEQINRKPKHHKAIMEQMSLGNIYSVSVCGVRIYTYTNPNFII